MPVSGVNHLAVEMVFRPVKRSGGWRPENAPGGLCALRLAIDGLCALRLAIDGLWSKHFRGSLIPAFQRAVLDVTGRLRHLLGAKTRRRQLPWKAALGGLDWMDPTCGS
jgi:hypothetical protein